MTLSEFKAWFEGFTEDMDGAPNKKQWERIKVRVGEITGQAVSYPIYIDRYVRPLGGYPYWAGGGIVTSSSAANPLAQAYNSALKAQPEPFDSHKAMSALGRADAQALKAA